MNHDSYRTCKKLEPRVLSPWVHQFIYMLPPPTQHLSQRHDSPSTPSAAASGPPAAALPLWLLEHETLPAVHLHLGETVIGRALFVHHDVHLPIVDFISREQLTMACSPDGSASVTFSTLRAIHSDAGGVLRGNNASGLRRASSQSWKYFRAGQCKRLGHGDQICLALDGDKQLVSAAVFTVRRIDPPAPPSPLAVAAVLSPAAAPASGQHPAADDVHVPDGASVGYESWLPQYQAQTDMAFDSEQLRCIKVACSLRRNLFYTGPGGVGKSLVARAIIDFFRCNLKNPADELAITAPTGIAATHIGGTTIHSAAGVGVPTFAVDFNKCWGKQEEIRRWNVLILDEVSMLSGEFWDWLFSVLMEINPTVQLIFCGDFFQLPPISKQLERVVSPRLVWDEATPFRPKLRVRVNKRRLDGSGTSEVFAERECVLMRGFAFESAAWWKADFVVVQLSTVWRQSEAETVARLGTLRKGTATPADVAWFNDRCTRPPLQLPVGSARPLLLAPTNATVDARNEQEMVALRLRGEPEYQWLAADWQAAYLKPLLDGEDAAAAKGRRDEIKEAERLLKDNEFYTQSLCEAVTRLCRDARCILLVNLDLDSEVKLCNGSLGSMDALASEAEVKAALEEQIEGTTVLIESLRKQWAKAVEERVRSNLQDRIDVQSKYCAKLRRCAGPHDAPVSEGACHNPISRPSVGGSATSRELKGASTAAAGKARGSFRGSPLIMAAARCSCRSCCRARWWASALATAFSFPSRRHGRSRSTNRRA